MFALVACADEIEAHGITKVTEFSVSVSVSVLFLFCSFFLVFLRERKKKNYRKPSCWPPLQALEEVVSDSPDTASSKRLEYSVTGALLGWAALLSTLETATVQEYSLPAPILGSSAAAFSLFCLECLCASRFTWLFVTATTLNARWTSLLPVSLTSLARGFERRAADKEAHLPLV